MNKVIAYAESNFRCLLGEPKAFFEIPQRDGDIVRVIYVVYALACLEEGVLEPAMIRTLSKLKEMGGEFLYWRNPEKVDIRQDDDGTHKYRIYTRIAVLNKDLEPVVLDDEIKPEGEPTREIAA